MSMAEERVIKIGMLGLGTVGTGVYKVLKSQQEEMLPKLGARAVSYTHLTLPTTERV